MWDLIPSTIEQALAWDSMDPRFTHQPIPVLRHLGSLSHPTLDPALLTSGMILNFGTPQTQQPATSGTGPTYQIQDSNPLTTHPEPGPLAPGYLHTRSSTWGRTWQTPGQGQPQKSVSYNRRIHTSHRGGTHRAYSSGDWRRVAGMYRITIYEGPPFKSWGCNKPTKHIEIKKQTWIFYWLNISFILVSQDFRMVLGLL